VPLVVELEEGRGVRVLGFQVQVVCLRFLCRVATVLADVDLRSPLFVLVLMVDAVNLQAVTFQRAPLGEGLFAVVAPIWTDSCMCSCVPLQIECIVEALSTEGAEVSLCIAVTLHVTIQQSRQTKGFSTSATGKPRRVIFTSHWRQLFTLLLLWHVRHHWVLDPVTAVDQLQMGILGDAVTLLEDEDTLLQVVDAEKVFLFVSVPRR